ncbi:MAG: hypothetical protein IT423_09045 [Pirellulaceae bacterium]|nr:hypothetical protein [Pirellulaceae bacterium]
MLLPAVAQEPMRLYAGASMVNITPPLGELIVGGFSPLPADDIHDELHARAIVLSQRPAKETRTAIGAEKPLDPQHTVAIVLCDNVGISREVFDVAKQLVQKETGLLPSHLLMAATHTHSATSARTSNVMIPGQPLESYQAFLSRRIADSIRLAVKRLAPAKIAWGSVDEPSELFNRRWFVKEEKDRRNPFGGVDTVRMNPGGAATLLKPAGQTDPQISFISVQHADGRPMAVLANYSLHYVGGVPARTISADYFAVFAQRMTELLQAEKQQPGFVGILSNGTSGDVNNINFQGRGPSLPSFEKMQRVGDLVARRVHAAMSALTYVDDVQLDARSSDLTLGVRKPTPEMLAYCEKILAQPESAERYHAQERVYAQRIRLQAEAGATVDVPLQVLRIGNLGIAAIPFEVFTETGLEIKQRSPLKPSFTIELAGGSYGYLPTPPQHALGGYETWLGTNKVEIGASTKIVTRLMEMFEEVAK